MGAPAGRLEKDSVIFSKEKMRELVQAEIDRTSPCRQKKVWGQFATPNRLAKEITEYALKLSDSERITLLEPSCGTGSFLSAFLSAESRVKLDSVVAYEIDSEIADRANVLWNDQNIQIINEDFTIQTPGDHLVDLVLANPPYTRHQNISRSDKSRMCKNILDELDLPVSGLSGAYLYFLLLTHKWLAKEAVSAWLIPAEFMDVNFGAVIKKYLTETVDLIRIHMFSTRTSEFHDANVLSAVVWFVNRSTQTTPSVSFTYGSSISNPERSRLIKKSNLKADSKWTVYFDEEKSAAASRLASQMPCTLGDFFTIRRGIATGNNKFFILDKSKVEERFQSKDFFVPILPGPRNLKESVIYADCDGTPLIENQQFLLSLPADFEQVKNAHPHIQRYLEEGKEETASRYLCKNRKKWFLQEKRKPALFLCTYIGRRTKMSPSSFRFILNYSQAIATNAYLMLYPKQKLQELLDSRIITLEDLWSVLKEVEKAIQFSSRSYGGGMKKIEPKELASVPCPELANLLNNKKI